jgi:hypothetical protein
MIKRGPWLNIQSFYDPESLDPVTLKLITFRGPNWIFLSNYIYIIVISNLTKTIIIKRKERILFP